MAKNLRAKIPAEDTLVVYDRVKESMERFVKEVGNTGGLEVASGPKDVAEKSVRIGSGSSRFPCKNLQLHLLAVCLFGRHCFRLFRDESFISNPYDLSGSIMHFENCSSFPDSILVANPLREAFSTPILNIELSVDSCLRHV